MTPWVTGVFLLLVQKIDDCTLLSYTEPSQKEAYMRMSEIFRHVTSDPPGALVEAIQETMPQCEKLIEGLYSSNMSIPLPTEVVICEALENVSQKDYDDTTLIIVVDGEADKAIDLGNAILVIAREITLKAGVWCKVSVGRYNAASSAGNIYMHPS